MWLCLPGLIKEASFRNRCCTSKQKTIVCGLLDAIKTILLTWVCLCLCEYVCIYYTYKNSILYYVNISIKLKKKSFCLSELHIMCAAAAIETISKSRMRNGNYFGSIHISFCLFFPPSLHLIMEYYEFLFHWKIMEWDCGNSNHLETYTCMLIYRVKLWCSEKQTNKQKYWIVQWNILFAVSCW